MVKPIETAGLPADVHVQYAPASPHGGLVAVEKWIEVMQDHGPRSSKTSEPVTFTARRFEDATRVQIRMRGTSLSMDLDDLVEITAALCPPWLLRKKLGL